MTQQSTRQRYLDLSSGSEAVESCLLPSLAEHLASELCLGSIASARDALTWMRSTYLFQRMTTNPAHYRLPKTATPAMIEEHCRTIALTHLLQLQRLQCVDIRLPVASAGAAASAVPLSSDGEAEEAFRPESVTELRSREASVSLRATPLTFIVSRHYLRLSTFALFLRMPREATLVQVLESLVGAQEVVSGMVVRRDEKRVSAARTSASCAA